MNTASSATPSAVSAAAPAPSAAFPAVPPMVPPTLLAGAVPSGGAPAGAPAEPLVLVTPQGYQTLQAGQANNVVAQPGRQYKLMRAAVGADNVIATQHGADLLLRYQDGTSVTLQGFYTIGQDGAVCSVLLPGDGATEYTLKGDSSGGASQADGATLVYAHGARDALMEMAQGQNALGEVFTALDEGTSVTYLPSAPVSASVEVPGSDLHPVAMLGLLGLGAAAVLAGGGGGTAAVVPQPVVPVVPVVTAPTTISGTVVAGAVITGQDLVVTATTAAGVVLASAIAVGADGKYTLTYTSDYVGAVLLRLSSSGSALDYMDETSLAGKNLNSNLFAVVTMASAGQSIIANITPLTTLAAYKIGLTSTQDGISGDGSAANVAAINNAVAKSFGLTTGSEQVITLLAAPVVSEAGAVQSGNAYGALLAAISGAELTLGQTTAQVLSTLAAGMTFAGSGVSFSNDAAGSAAKGALVQGASQATQSAVLSSANVLQLFTSVLATSDSTAAPQALVFGDAVTLLGPVHVGTKAATAQISFKLSTPSANFTLASITVTGGTLGALTVDTADPTLYHATFTPGASDALAATISVNAGVFVNAGGVANVASNAFAISGDTLAPAAPVLSEQGSTVLSDGVVSLTELVINLQVSLPASGSAAHAGDSVALLLNGAAFATPLIHTLSAADIASGSVAFSVARATLGADGAKTLSATLTDVAGNIGAASAALSFALDSRVDLPTLALIVDSGASSTDRVTNAAGFNVGALKVASATVIGFDHLQYQLDSTSGTWLAGAAGVTSVPGTALAGIADGAHTLYVSQVDLAGTVSAAASVAFKLDTTAPGLPAIALSSDSGTSGTDGITNKATFSAGALEVASGTASGFDHLQYQLDSSAGIWLAGASGVSTVTPTGVADGAHTLYVRQVDLAGNFSASTSAAFTLDTTAPLQTVSAVSLSADTGTSALDHVTQTVAQTITATLSAALASGDVLQGSLDGGTTWTALNAMVSGTTITWTGATLVGSNSIVFRLTDLAGNLGAITGATPYVLDTSAPVTSVSAVTLSADTGISATDHITNTAAQTIHATLGAALSAGDVLQGSLDNGLTWTALNGMISGTAIAWTGATLAGSNSIVFRTTDLAGNVGSNTAGTAYVLDTGVPVGPTVALTTDSGTSSTDGITNSAALTVGGLDVANAATSASGFSYLRYQLDSSTGTWIAGLPGITSVPAAAFASAANGAHTAYVDQVDVAGNVSAATSLPFTLDTTAPAVSSVSIGSVPSGATNLAIGNSVSVSVVMSEPVTVTGVPTYAIALDSGAHVASYVSGSGSNTLVFNYAVATGDSDLGGGVTAALGALVLPSGAALADLAGNQASLVVPAIAAGANSVHIDTSAPAVTNAAVLAGQTSFDVTSNLILNFGTPLSAATAGMISVVNDANSTSKAGYAGEAAAHTQTMYFGAHTSSAGVTTVQTYSSATTQTAATLSGSLSIVDATGVVTVNPLYDLDLSNNYHLEIAANSFTNSGNGLSNAAFGALTAGAYALSFSTVSPGTNAGGGTAAVAMTGASALTPGHTWIDITTLGDITSGTVANVTSATGSTAYVIANKNAVASDTVILSETTDVLLPALRTGDVLYVDNSVNGRISSLSSSASDATWSANSTNNGALLGLSANTIYPADIGIPLAAFTTAVAMNAAIDALVANHQIIVA